MGRFNSRIEHGGLMPFSESCNISTTKHLILKCNTTFERKWFLQVQKILTLRHIFNTPC